MTDNFNTITITSDTVYLTISGNWNGSFAIEASLDGDTWGNIYDYLPGLGACTLKPFLSKYLRARPINVTGNPIIQWGTPTSQEPIEHRFSRHQTISNTGVLLYKLMEACSSFLEWEIYGTSYKHGLDNSLIREEKRVGFAAMALELLQEIGLSKDELEQAWQEAQQNREELEQISRDMRPKEH